MTAALMLIRKTAAILFNNRFHVIFMPVILLWFWDVALHFSAPWYYYFMIATSTAGTYIYNMWTDEKEDRINYPSDGRIFTPDSKMIRPIIFLCYAVAVTIGSVGGWRYLMYGTIYKIFGVLYGTTLPIGNRSFRIKANPWLKNAYSAVMWSVGLILFPYLYLGSPVPLKAVLAMFISFLMVFFVELAWDLRDMKGDAAAGVWTIPLCLGQNAARWLLHFLNGASVLLILAGVIWSGFPAAYLVVLIHGILAALYIEWYLRSQYQHLLSHLYLIYGSVVALIVILTERIG